MTQCRGWPFEEPREKLYTKQDMIDVIEAVAAALQPKWVGLTDEEIEEYKWMGGDVIAVIKEIQATLKEKNT